MRRGCRAQTALADEHGQPDSEGEADEDRRQNEKPGSAFDHGRIHLYNV
jgi:hypothetical protein